MQVTIDITSTEAETILFALALRSKQTKLPPQLIGEAVTISERLNKSFEQSFGWQSYDRTKHYRKPLKRVSITTYDYPPEV